MKKSVRLAITSGDADGIGLEICVKSLLALGPKARTTFFLYRSRSAPKKYIQLLDQRFRRAEVSSFKDYEARFSNSDFDLIDIASEAKPAKWVIEVARLCLSKNLDGLATAPLSKTAIRASGFREIGHTELIQKVSRSPNPFMAFVGEKFNVVLATGHISLKKIRITKELLYRAGLAAIEFKKILRPQIRQRPIALVGLNPHAGENNIIGSEESNVFAPVVRRLSKKTRVVGPLVPDAAFLPQNWHRYSTYLCPYHDQGLIPFKAFNGAGGVHLTLGIPFVRTSVDHGTAKDIYGRDKADASSMKNAIELAIKLIRKKG